MRISGDRKDPDYATGAKVFFNGREVTVLDADDVTGRITIHPRTSDGKMIRGKDGMPAIGVMHGKVEIVFDRVEEKPKEKSLWSVCSSVDVYNEAMSLIGDYDIEESFMINYISGTGELPHQSICTLIWRNHYEKSQSDKEKPKSKPAEIKIKVNTDELDAAIKKSRRLINLHKKIAKFVPNTGIEMVGEIVSVTPFWDTEEYRALVKIIDSMDRKLENIAKDVGSLE